MITVEPETSKAARTLGGDRSFRKNELQFFLRKARQACGLTGRVDVLLAGDATLRRLNREFRCKDKTTDVLSFPAVSAHRAPAGDIAISLDTAARQARQHGHSLEDELKILLLHGVLHLRGHDHESDNGEMLALEQKLRRKLGLPGSLTERARGAA